MDDARPSCGKVERKLVRAKNEGNVCLSLNSFQYPANTGSCNPQILSSQNNLIGFSHSTDAFWLPFFFFFYAPAGEGTLALESGGALMQRGYHGHRGCQLFSGTRALRKYETKKERG